MNILIKLRLCSVEVMSSVLMPVVRLTSRMESELSWIDEAAADLGSYEALSTSKMM